MKKSSLTLSPVKGLDQWWNLFGLRFADLHGGKQGSLAVSRYLAVKFGDLEVARSSRPPGGGTQDGGEIRESEPPSSNGRANKGFGGVVLFVPNTGASYCLGTCLKLAHQLKDRHPETLIKFLTSFDGGGEIGERFAAYDWFRIRKGLNALHPKSLVSAVFICRRYLARMTEVEEIACAARLVFGKRWRWSVGIWIVRHLLQTEVALRWLKKEKIDAVVTINDVVKPGACFVTAAQRLEIPSILLQHGTLGPISAPFQAEECWVWGPTSTEYLQSLGVSRSRIFEVGNLEIEGHREAESLSGSKVVLILLQWVGAKIWDEPVFREIVSDTAAAMAKICPDWTLRIRLHPLDGEDVQAAIRALLQESPVRLHFSPRDTTVAEDVRQASAALTVNSSALAHALVLRKPYLQYLPLLLEERIGTRFAGGVNVARNPDQLGSWLSRVVSGELPEAEVVSEAFANLGEGLQVGADRLSSLLGAKL